MLEISTNPSNVQYLRPAKVPDCHVLTGASLAQKRDLNPRKRAKLAGRWLLGSLTLTPTLTMAAKVFGVSIPLVIEERATLMATTAPMPILDRVWQHATPAERDQFVQDHLNEVWTLIDRATAQAA